MRHRSQRRAFLKTVAAIIVPGMASVAAAEPVSTSQSLSSKHNFQNGVSPWPLCLDTATIRPATLEDKIRIAAKAGFDAIEPWEGDLHQYEEQGGSLKDLGKRILDAGLFVPSVIGLWNAIPATQEEFDKSLVDSRRRMRQAAAIGAQHIQVVPQPARPWQEFDPKWAADRYRDLERDAEGALQRPRRAAYDQRQQHESTGDEGRRGGPRGQDGLHQARGLLPGRASAPA